MGKNLKIVILGRTKSGKTLLLNSLFYKVSFEEKLKNYIPTIEDVYPFVLEYEKGNKDRIFFYDTKGLENMDDQQIQYYLSFADAVILIYKASVSETENVTHGKNLDYLKKDIELFKDRKDLILMVIGTYLTSEQPNLYINKQKFLPSWIFKDKNRSTSFMSKKAKSFISEISSAAASKKMD